MKFTEILSRVTGLSVPVFGMSWNPPEAEVTVARRVISFLEDRRVLTNIMVRDDVERCVKSVLKLREFLTEELGKLTSESGVAPHLKAMRAACRKFLTTLQDQEIPTDNPIFELPPGQSLLFNASLGEMRGVFGTHVAQIAAKYGLDVDDGLARILPSSDEA